MTSRGSSRAIAAIAFGDGPKALSFAPKRTSSRWPDSRISCSGPMNGVVAGIASTAGSDESGCQPPKKRWTVTGVPAGHSSSRSSMMMYPSARAVRLTENERNGKWMR